MDRLRPRQTPIHILDRHALIDRQGCVEIPGLLVEFWVKRPPQRVMSLRGSGTQVNK